MTKKNGGIQLQRLKSFQKFIKNYVDDSLLSIFPPSHLSKVLPANSIVVVGSGQVWNTTWISPDQLKMRLGAWAPAGSLISYAASFGIDSISDPEYREIFKKYLPRFSKLSVREYQGVEIIKDLVNEQSSVVLDPTLMLTREQWLQVIPQKYKQNNEKYVLTYFLGEPSQKQESIIQQYAKEHNCKIKRLLDLSDPETYVAGPREFVGLFANAQYVFTDSYHACCFSILFEKQFKVFNRANISSENNMNSRMKTLFRLFKLGSMLSVDIQEKIDYAQVNLLLDAHRKTSRKWLDETMGTIQE